MQINTSVREYGWRKRGICIEGKKRGLRYLRINLVAGKIGNSLTYSPDLNPIEKLWADMKKKLKDIAHNFNTLEEAVTSVLFNKLVQF